MEKLSPRFDITLLSPRFDYINFPNKTTFLGSQLNLYPNPNK